MLMPYRPTTLRDGDGGEIVRYLREKPPAHFIFKIESFSLMSKTWEKYRSSDFKSGGYKWELSIYPSGDKKNGGDGHISLYLSISDTSTLSQGWEVSANCKLFVYDRIRDKYMSVHDNYEGIRRFHGMKNEWGFAQFISLSTFNQASNGFLVNDSCVFGAEIFVIKPTNKCERLLMFKGHVTAWKISYFSSLTGYESHDSRLFKVGNYNWKVKIYAKGNGTGKDTHLSLFLSLVDTKLLQPNQTIYVIYKLRIRNPLSHALEEGTGDSWYSVSNSGWGFREFITLSDLHNVSKGFLTNDTLMVEVEFLAMSEVSDLPDNNTRLSLPVSNVSDLPDNNTRLSPSVSNVSDVPDNNTRLSPFVSNVSFGLIVHFILFSCVVAICTWTFAAARLTQIYELYFLMLKWLSYLLSK